MQQDLDTLIADLELFLASPSFAGGVKVIEDVAKLMKDIFSGQPGVVTSLKGKRRASVLGGAPGLLADLKTERAATAIDWAKILQILIALLQVIGPIILA